VLEIVVEPVLMFAFYFTGKVIVWLITAGRIRPDISEPKVKSKPWTRPVIFTHEGQRYMDVDAVAFVGLIFWILVLIAVIAYFVLR